MNTFIIPHAHLDYTSACFEPIFRNIMPQYSRIVYVSTLHSRNPNILYSNTATIGQNSLDNDLQMYRMMQNAKGVNLLLDNDIENKEHSLVFNVPFLEQLILKAGQSATGPDNNPDNNPNNNPKLSVFYVNNDINRIDFFKFIDGLNEIFRQFPSTLFLFNTDFSHLNISNDTLTETDEFAYTYIEDELNDREMRWINRLLNEKKIPYQQIESFVGCGGGVVVMVSHLDFIQTGQLLCKTDNQTKENYVLETHKNTPKIPNNRLKIVSYVTIGYLPNPFQIIQFKEPGTGQTRYKIHKVSTNKTIKCVFKSKQSAMNQVNNWIRFRKMTCDNT